MTLSELAPHLDSAYGGADVQFSSVSIDTRTLRTGDLYIAIQGANFDGHDFVAEAGRKGASAAIVSRQVEVSLPQLEVPDTTAALGKLGQLNRLASKARVVAITGSQGKTTVKEMTGAILAEAGHTLVTQGNLNNAIGVPLTLLQLDRSHQFAVIEMGANHAGEIAYSVNLVKPDVATITNAARAHIEGFGSMEGVARSKGEIIDGLGADGTMVLNRDDVFYEQWRARAGSRRKVSFSVENPDAEYFGSELASGAAGGSTFRLLAHGAEQSVSLGLLGRHNIGNAVAAAALAMEAGADLGHVKAGLESIRPVKGRLCPVDNKLGGRLIDDSYNASPESFKAAMNVLAGIPGRRILLMGDMAELGDTTIDAHRELGEYASEVGLDGLWTIGDASRDSSQVFGQGGRHFDDSVELVECCKDELRNGAAILVKGSRSAGLDRIVDAVAGRSQDGKQ